MAVKKLVDLLSEEVLPMASFLLHGTSQGLSNFS